MPAARLLPEIRHLNFARTTRRHAQTARQLQTFLQPKGVRLFDLIDDGEEAGISVRPTKVGESQAAQAAG